MTWWNRLLGTQDTPEKVDYYEEGHSLLLEGKHHEALTSFRLALKDAPGDALVLQQIAIVYTRIGMIEEAAKTYRHVLQKDPAAAGAHYGLAFILLRAGEDRRAETHLHAFLEHAPEGPEGEQHIAHARSTLARLQAERGEE